MTNYVVFVSLYNVIPRAKHERIHIGAPIARHNKMPPAAYG